MSFEELLEEASMDVQEAANSCSCGEHQQLMGAFEAVEGDCVVAAAAGIVAALLSCKCDRSRGLLLEALDVVAQLGDSPGEEEQLLRLWTAGVGSAGQEQSAAALAVCVDTGGLADEDLSLGSSGSLVSGRVQEAGMGDLFCVDPGPADSAVAAGWCEWAVGSELESLAKKVGSALVSGSSEPINQIQAYDEEKVGNGGFSAAAAAAAVAAATDSVSAAAAAAAAPPPAPTDLPVEMPAPAPAPVPAPAPAQMDAGDLAPGLVRAGA